MQLVEGRVGIREDVKVEVIAKRMQKKLDTRLGSVHLLGTGMRGVRLF